MKGEVYWKTRKTSQKLTFQEEYKWFLEKFKVDYDEKYVFNELVWLNFGFMDLEFRTYGTQIRGGETSLINGIAAIVTSLTCLRHLSKYIFERQNLLWPKALNKTEYNKLSKKNI